MEEFMGMKLKRKDLDQVNDDFSDFSLSSPARKIRRLNVELPPIIEEEEVEMPGGYKKLMSENAVTGGMSDQMKPLEIEELPFVPENEEKAIVLFKPMKNSVLCSPHCSYSVDPSFISSFKNQVLFGSHLNKTRTSEEGEAVRNGDNEEDNTCRAVIPWVPSQQLEQRPVVVASQYEVSEAMDTEEMEEATMEIEDAGAPNFGQQANTYINQFRINEGLQHQWQQQHCMLQQPQNTTTPIVWYR